MMPNQEIERKFLLRKMPDNLEQLPHYHISQGYLVATGDGRQVRLRKTPSSCTLTFKTADGAVREEREIEITPEQFEALWPATTGRRLNKTRFEMPWEGWMIEIDRYHGINDGLVVAEVEFETESDCAGFRPPDWFGEEVTDDRRYSNVALARE